MSFAGLLQTVSPATRWWRRPHGITLNFWPSWLAKALCPHAAKAYFSDDKTIWRCEDCFKFNFPQATTFTFTDEEQQSAARDH